jgi:hypothetical protein
MKYTSEGDAAACKAPSTTTVTYPDDAALPTGCSSSCTGDVVTTVCSSVTSGETLSLTFTATGGSGTLTLTELGPDGGVTQSCTFAIEVTKQ